MLWSFKGWGGALVLSRGKCSSLGRVRLDYKGVWLALNIEISVFDDVYNKAGIWIIPGIFVFENIYFYYDINTLIHSWTKYLSSF